MMKSGLLTGLVASTGILISASAHAGVITFSAGGTIVAGQGEVSSYGVPTTYNFDSSVPTFTNVSSGGVAIFTAADSSPVVGGANAAEPYGDTSSFASVGSGSIHPASATIVAPSGSTYIGLYLGSVDSFNNITLNQASGASITYDGDQLFNPANPTGNQGNGGSVYLNFFDTGSTFTSITFTSNGTAEEFDNVAFASAVPEPATWAMMILGFLGIGFLSYRKSSGSALRMA
jgi:hypothetical protein